MFPLLKGSEGILLSSSESATCPVSTCSPDVGNLQNVHFCGGALQGRCEYQFLLFCLTRPRIEPEFTAYVLVVYALLT